MSEEAYEPEYIERVKTYVNQAIVPATITSHVSIESLIEHLVDTHEELKEVDYDSLRNLVLEQVDSSKIRYRFSETDPEPTADIILGYRLSNANAKDFAITNSKSD